MSYRDYLISKVLTCSSIRHMNAIIMNYLISEGYAKAAEDFAREANLSPDTDISYIEERKKIKKAIYAGRIMEAIADINEINPTVSSYSSLSTLL